MKTKITFILFFLIPTFVYAQSVPIIVLTTSEIPEFNETIRGFIDSVKYKIKNADISIHNLKKEDKKLLIQKIKKEKPMLIFSVGTKSLSLLQKNVTEIPIIFTMVWNWNELVVNSKNITGISMRVPIHTFLKYYDIVFPKKKIGIVIEEKETKKIDEFRKYCKEFNIQMIEGIIKNDVKNTKVPYKSVKKTLKDILKKAETVYFNISSRFTSKSVKYIIKQCKKQKIPLFSFSEKISKIGGWISIEPDYSLLGQHAANLAKKIIIEKTKPYKIKVRTPVAIKFVIHSKYAKKINLNLDRISVYFNQIY